jgi:beta-glucosidase
MPNGELEDLVRELNQRDAARLTEHLEFLRSDEGLALVDAALVFQANLDGAGEDGVIIGTEPEPSATGADAVITLLEGHPGFRERRELQVGLSIFSEAELDELTLLDLRGEAAAVVAHGAAALALGPPASPPHVRSLLHVALGADAFSATIRKTLAGKPIPGPPVIDVIPAHLLDLREAVDARTCVRGLQRALTELQQAAASRQPATSSAAGIQRVVPSRGCAGTQVRIQGSGFGASQAPDVEVRFPRRPLGCVAARQVLSWSDGEIVAVAPDGVGTGCVGFVTAGSGDSAAVAAAASAVAGQLVTCLGPMVSEAAERITKAGLPHVPCPPCLPGGTNRFSGGRPVIDFFRANGAETLNLLSDAGVRLSWGITGATSVEIEAVRIGGQRNQLRPIAAPLDPSRGELDLGPVAGSFPWEGAYVLRARNDCTPADDPETGRVLFQMRPRPPTQLFGVATAGAQNEGGITDNDWHAFTTNPVIVGDVLATTAVGEVLGLGRTPVIVLRPAEEAVRHADLVQVGADVERAAALGCNAYRFSVEWSRVEPSPGATGAALEAYYVPLVAWLRAQGMEPVVTLSHFALPRWVLEPPGATFYGPLVGLFSSSLRGWENPQTVDRWIAFVGRVVNRLKDEGVRTWIPLNEPVGLVAGGYVGGVFPPGFRGSGGRAKTAYFNLLRAHVRAYDEIKRIQPEARVGIAQNVIFFKQPHQPGLTGNHIRAGTRMKYFYNDHFLRSVMAGTVDTRFDVFRDPQDRDPAERSDQFYGIPSGSWRPKLDFLGINYYRSVYPYHFIPLALPWVAPFVGGQFDLDMHLSPDPHELLLDIGWEIFPEGLYLLLKELWDEHRLPILISENGAGEGEEQYRSTYTVAHLEQMERARTEGVNILGYLHWTLVDNWEWHFNYEPKARFGVLRVDRGAVDANGRRILPRRMTDAALALQYASAEDAGSLRRRFGSITPNGRFGVAPELSPGALWQGASPGGPQLALYLAPRTSGAARFLGMIFDYAAGRWVRLDDVVFDAATRTLSLFHRGKATVPSREYTAVATGDRLAGTFVEAGQSRPWQVDRVLPHGAWGTITGLPLSAIVLSNIGKWEDKAIASPEVWTGRAMTPSGGMLDAVTVLDVSWTGSVLTLTGPIPHAQLGNRTVTLTSNAVTRSAIVGIVTNTGGHPGLSPGGTWQARRLDDGLAF